MERLTTWPSVYRGRRPIYDYDTLLDGNIYECKRGVDFKCKRVSFMSTMRKEALSRNLHFRHAMLDDEDTIVIQAYTPQNPS